MALGRKKTPDEYKDFEDTIIKHFGNRSITDKETLRFLMQKKGYRQVRITDRQGRSYVDRNARPKDKQVNFVWNTLQRKQPKQKTIGIRFHYVVEKGNRRRSTKYFEYKNKKYYKGRFIPKEINNE